MAERGSERWAREAQAVADDAEALMEGACAQLAVGGTIGTNFCYKLVFAEGLYESIWEIAVPAYEAVDWNLRRRLADAGYYADLFCD